MHGDPEFDRWMEQLAEKCECCPICYESPCGGCQQGGLCDGVTCRCDEYGEDYDAEEEDWL